MSYFERKATTTRSRQASIYLCGVATLRRCVQKVPFNSAIIAGIKNLDAPVNPPPITTNPKLGFQDGAYFSRYLQKSWEFHHQNTEKDKIENK